MPWLNAVAQGVLLGGLYALYGAGLSLIFGVMRIVNLAHGDFIVVGAYVALVAAWWLGLTPFASLLVVVPLLFLAGVALQRTTLNRTLGRGPMPALVITFGVSVILQNGLLLGFSANSQGLDAGAIERASFPVAGLALGVLPLITFSLAVAVIGALQLFLSRSSLGRAFRAVSDDPRTAELMGINSRQVYALAMGLSLAIVGLAGVLLGIRTIFAPADGPARLVYAFETVIIGGLGSLWGTLAGGVILGVSQAVGAQINPTWFQLAGHVVTVIVLIFRPQGLFPRTREE
jgi:branched-chain amino acid transport system permease protein